MSDCKCGHPQSRHEANECWTDMDTGEETWGGIRTQCSCSTFQAA